MQYCYFHVCEVKFLCDKLNSNENNFPRTGFKMAKKGESRPLNAFNPILF